MVLTKLLKQEQGWFLDMQPPIGAVSFYRLDGEHGRNGNYLLTRFIEVLKANPWLCGRLVEQKVEGTTDRYISFCEEIENPLNHIFNITDEEIFKLTEWNEIMDHLNPHHVKMNKDCIGKDEILCKLIIFQNTSSTALALMLSLNHAIGDGYTFYHIWKMLSTNEEVSSMCVERFHDVETVITRDTNLLVLDYRTMSGLLREGFSCFGRGISRKLRRKRVHKWYMYKVDGESIRKMKTEYNANDSFVSTNDILCSWIFRNCESGRGLEMAVDARGRIAELTKEMAGNYLTFCSMDMSSINSPADFREVWTNIIEKRVPVYKSSSLNYSISWANFYHQVELDTYTHIFHLPVIDRSEVILDVLGIPLGPECFMLSFKLNNDDVGVLLHAYSDVLTEDFFDKSEVLDGKVSLNSNFN